MVNGSDAQRAWFKAHREEKRAYDAERYQRVAERKRQQAREWYAANKERARERIQRWQEANPDRVSDYRWRSYWGSAEVAEAARLVHQLKEEVRNVR